MPKFVVYESATIERMYLIEAETEDDARDIVDEGYSDPVRTDYIDREIFNIKESEDDN